jgi:PAS domain S-box-containing protein
MPVLLTVLLGLLASAAGAYLFYDGESERLHLELDFRADWRAKDLESKLRAVGTPVGGFATFLATELADGVAPDAGTFARWAGIRGNYVDNKPRAYYWWPYLSAHVGSTLDAASMPQPDPGFQTPLRYIPGDMASQAGPAALDAEALAVTREVLIRAWFSGVVRVSRPYRSRGWPDDEATEILFAAPVYKGGRVPGTIADRQANIAGVVAASFSLHDVLENSIKGTPRLTEAIYLSEQPWPSDDTRQYFARFDPATGHFIMELGTVRPSDLDGVVIAKRVEGPGVNAYLLFQFLPAEVQSNRTPGPWLFLITGLVLTAAATSYVQRSLRRRDALTVAVSMSDARLRRTHRELEAVIQSSPAAIVCIDNEGAVTVWNMAAERLFGVSAVDAMGHPHRPPPMTSDETDAPDLGRAIAEGRMIDGTASLLTADGRRHDVSVRSASLTRDEGELPGAVYIASDVTDLVLLEDQLRQAQKMEAVGQLTGGVAHDFNNLLAVVIGNLDLIGTAFSAESRNARLLDGALRAALRGAELTRALLAFARRQPLEPAPVDVNQLIENVCQLLEHSLGEAITADRELQVDLWPVNIDAVQLESALTNLAINARDAMSSGGRLLIQTRNTHLDKDYASREPGLLAGDYVVIEVTDNGHGMPPEVLAHAAEPFFTTKEEGKGTGLGLAMVYGFVKQSSGHMKIYSEVGRGTTIRLYLPRLSGRYREASVSAPTPAAASVRETVLVVEDNLELRRLVVSQLRDLGYRVIEAADGAQALEIANGRQKIDLVFSDVVMRGHVSGLDLAREFRHSRPDVKLLLTSGFPGAMSAKEREIEPGFVVPILTKPYRREELARQLRAVLDGVG